MAKAKWSDLALKSLAEMPPAKRAKAWAVFEGKATKLVDRPVKRATVAHSKSWKGLERYAAEVLGGKRISRGADFSREDVDVDIPDFPEFRVDAKYREAHSHHTLMAEIIRKYCGPGQEPVLVTKHHQQDGAYATIRLTLLGELMNLIRSM